MEQQIAISTIPHSVFKTIPTNKKKKSPLKITYIKVKVFFWNLSPIHWYDNFKDIHIDMNEFISPKNKK
jgi:hypothetical protein